MKRKALIFGLIALASLAEISSAQGKGGGTTGGRTDAVTGINIVLLDPGGTAIPMITWNTIDKATFQVQRSKVGDSCCTASSPAGLTTTSWQDTRLPSSGTYVYRVIATLKSGQVVGESQMTYTAPATGGRYRLSIRSIQVVTPTADDPTQADGTGDEVYAAAVAVRVDRNTGARLGATVVRSKEYGDIGNNGSTYPNRIRAGTASPMGGLNGGSVIGDPGTPGAETFPFVLWEGALTNGGEAVVVVPSIWERDTDDRPWNEYSANWMSAQAPLLGSQLFQTQYRSTTLTPVAVTPETGGVIQNFTGPIYGSYSIGLDRLSGVDRPIGWTTATGANPVYSERAIILTSEKLAGMVVGGTSDLQLQFNESDTQHAGYNMILRVERIG